VGDTINPEKKPASITPHEPETPDQYERRLEMAEREHEAHAKAMATAFPGVLSFGAEVT
jgi:hypothetical protein